MISPKGIVSCGHYLILAKDQGGLLYLSGDVLKILKTCEVALKNFVRGKDFQNPKIMQKSKSNFQKYDLTSIASNIF